MDNLKLNPRLIRPNGSPGLFQTQTFKPQVLANDILKMIIYDQTCVTSTEEVLNKQNA